VGAIGRASSGASDPSEVRDWVACAQLEYVVDATGSRAACTSSMFSEIRSGVPRFRRVTCRLAHLRRITTFTSSPLHVIVAIITPSRTLAKIEACVDSNASVRLLCSASSIPSHTITCSKVLCASNYDSDSLSNALQVTWLTSSSCP
jgi:hypothetical protein